MHNRFVPSDRSTPSHLDLKIAQQVFSGNYSFPAFEGPVSYIKTIVIKLV